MKPPAIVALIAAIALTGSQVFSSEPASETDNASESASETDNASESTSENGSTSERGCLPNYPGLCIPPKPPDLDCGDITHQNFKVQDGDPHGFDGNNNGIGCEEK